MATTRVLCEACRADRTDMQVGDDCPHCGLTARSVREVVYEPDMPTRLDRPLTERQQAAFLRLVHTLRAQDREDVLTALLESCVDAAETLRDAAAAGETVDVVVERQAGVP